MAKYGRALRIQRCRWRRSLLRTGITMSIVRTGSKFTNPVSYTPTFGGIGSPSSVIAFYQRVGDRIKVWGSCIAGTISANPLTIGLPTGLTLNASKISTTAQTVALGYAFTNMDTVNTSIPTSGRGPYPIIN